MPKRKPRRNPTIRPGRPPLPAGEKRIHQLPLNLSPLEYLLLQRRADHLGVPAPVLARSLALHGRISAPPVPRANYAVVGHLGRIGNLLRQAERQIQSGRLTVDLRPWVEQILGTIASLRHRLVSPQS